MHIDGTEMGPVQPPGWVWEAGREAAREETLVRVIGL